jgi:hypothetical protein
MTHDQNNQEDDNFHAKEKMLNEDISLKQGEEKKLSYGTKRLKRKRR